MKTLILFSWMVVFYNTNSIAESFQLLYADSSRLRTTLLRHFQPWPQKELTGKVLVRDGDDNQRYAAADSCISAFLPYHGEFDNHYEPAHYVTYKGFTILFIRHLIFDMGRKEFVEDDLIEYIMAVFTNEGKLTDHKIIGKDGWTDFTDIRGCINKLVCKQGHLPLSEYSLYNDLPFIVTTHEYTITDEGLIVDRVVGTPKKEIRQPKFPAKKDAPFKGLLALFQQWQKSSLDRSVFCSPSEEGKRLEIGREYEHLIPGFLSRTSETEDIWWQPGQYMELDSVYVLFATRMCTPSYPCCEFRIMTYTKDGKPIDSRCISREGDIWQDDIKASTKPLALAVRQWEIDGREINENIKHPKVTTTLFSIGQDGKITEQPLRESNCPSYINLKAMRTEWSNN